MTHSPTSTDLTVPSIGLGTPGEVIAVATADSEASRSGPATACIYLRVSTAEQTRRGYGGEGYSIPAQRDACHAKARQLGASIVREYIEPGKSATSRNRPALLQMLAELDDLHPSHVIFYDLSRSARNERDAYWILEEITERGIKLISTQENFDDSAEGMLQFGTHTNLNAYRSRNDGKKVKVGLVRKHEEGGTIGPARPGYLNVRSPAPGGYDVAAIALDPDRAPLIRLAFDLALKGESVSQISELVAAAGLTSRPTPTRPAKPYGRATIYRILRNDYYAGIVTRRGEKRVGRHDPIVTVDEFDKVQEILSASRVGSARGSRKHHHYLSGLLVCQRCDNRFGYSNSRGKMGAYYEYYNCLSRVTPQGACGICHLRLTYVEDRLEQTHRRDLLTRTEQTAVRELVRRTAERQVEVARTQSAQHRRRHRELISQQQKLVQLYYEGGISLDVMQAEQARIEQEKADAKHWQATADRQVDRVMERLEQASTSATATTGPMPPPSHTSAGC